MSAAVQVADAIQPLNDQRQQGEQPVQQDAVGVVVADVLDAVAILGIVEPLVLDLPTALGHVVQPGQVFMPMHDVQTNRLTFAAFDPQAQDAGFRIALYYFCIISPG